MNCFDHRSENAIGICARCGKGVCSLCALEQKVGISCQEKTCQEQLELRYQINNQYNDVLKVSNSKIKTSAIILLVLGLLFIFMAITSWITLNYFGTLEYGFLVAGIIMLVVSVQNYRRKYSSLK